MKLKFECTQSGRCCVSKDQPGYVFLCEADIVRMEKHLGVDRSVFAAVGEFDVVRGRPGPQVRWYLKNTEKRCPFLKEGKCSVYEARPAQCRTWPFWPEHMNAKGWDMDKIGHCAGINKGKEHTEEEIKEIMEADRVAFTSGLKG